MLTVADVQRNKLNRDLLPYKRMELNYTLMDEGQLLELFSLYCSLNADVFLDDVTRELSRRAALGELDIFNFTPPPLNEDVPHWLKTWPFSLLSAHLRGGGVVRGRG